jgi:PTS system mannose-specific IIA component
MVGCIVLTHGDLCFGLKDTLEGIMGKQKGFSVISNVGLGKEELVSALKEKVDDSDYSEGAVIFVDMFGTSCWQTAKKLACAASKDERQVAVITGVNLPMLVKFFSLRESLPVDQMLPLIKEEGEKVIKTES